MRKVSGSVTFGGRVAYCSQTAWIQNATLVGYNGIYPRETSQLTPFSGSVTTFFSVNLSTKTGYVQESTMFPIFTQVFAVLASR